jgi:fumarate hydratase class I
MAAIQREHLVQSVADALQFISYYHPRDYIQALGRAYEREQSGAAKDAIAQILTNSRLCAEGRRPICQDTGIVNVMVKVGMGGAPTWIRTTACAPRCSTSRTSAAGTRRTTRRR